MKRIAVIFCCLISMHITYGQSGQNEILTTPDQTVKERFQLMKTKSQTYQDYKVIKEYVLDGVLKIIQDSLQAKDNALRSVKADVNRLKEELNQVNLVLKQKDQSMAEIVHASTHITVIGIDFQKKSFLTLVVLLLVALLLVVAFFAARLKMFHTVMREKSELLDIVSKEYEDYKRKALEKQTKLSRELQDERNKLHR